MKLPTSICLTATTLLTGCAGYNSMLFVTKTNVGVDYDTKPPTLETTIARREVVVAPALDGGKPPVMASFVKTKGNGALPFFPNISTTFAGGDAAKTISRLYGSSDSTANSEKDESAIYSNDKPAHKFLGFIPIHFFGKGDVSPFIFGTDTTLGLKVAWSGTTAVYPDTARLGYQRKEIALAPVFTTVNDTKPTNGMLYKSKIASFLATMNSSTNVGGVSDTNVENVQYFATGAAADNLALQPEVRRAMIQRMDPNGKALADAGARTTEANTGTPKKH